MKNSMVKKIMPLVPGLGLAALIAAVSQFLSLGHPALDPLVISILVGIILGNLIGPRPALDTGITFSQKFVIPLGIVLYGTQMEFQPLEHFGADRVCFVLTAAVACIVAVIWCSRIIGIRKNIGMLIAAGSAICGASAIIVLSPVIRAEKEETSVSLLSITIIGLAGVILYPLVQEIMSLSEERYAFLCGSTLPQVGQVQAAAALMGESAVKLALPVKLLRVMMLLPAAIVYSVMTGRQQPGKVYVPWFLVGFLIAAAAVNFFPSFASAGDLLAPAARFLFSIALAGIGLSIDLESIIDEGPKPLLVSLLALIFLVILYCLGTALIG